MMYQLIAGRPPFDSKAAGELIVMHMTEPPPTLLSLAPDLPPSLIPTLVPVIERLLIKSAAARPPMNEVAQQLQALTRQLQSESAEGLKAVSAPVVAVAPPSVTEAAPGAAEGAQLTVQMTPSGDLSQTPKKAAIEPPPSDPPAELGSGPTAAMAAETASTLGQSVGQFPVASRRRFLFVAPPAFLVVLFLFIVQQAWRSPKSPKSSAASQAPSSATAPVDAQTSPVKRTKWQLRSDPAGASVVRKADGQELGKTPLWIDSASSGGPLSIELRLAGFVSADVELRQEDEEQRLVHLTAERRMPPSSRLPVAKKKERAKVGKSFFDGID